jgi:hypothetical protein
VPGRLTPADVVVVLHARRHRRADDLTAPALHHEEVGAEDGGVVTEEVGARGAVEVTPESGEDLELAPHVVRARGDLTHRRPAQHQLVRADAEQIGQVRRSVRELEDVDGPLDPGQERRQPRTEPGVERCPVQLLAGPDRSDLGRLGHGDVLPRGERRASRAWAA